MTLRITQVVTVPLSLRFLRMELLELRRRGVEVTIISAPGPELEPFGRAVDIDIVAVPMARRITPIRDLVTVVRIARAIRRERPEIVHAHTPKGGLLGMLGAWLARAPVRIYRMRGLPLETATGLRRLLLWTTEWLSCALAHRVIAVAPSLRERAIGLRLCPPDKIIYLAHGSGQGVDASGRLDPASVDPAAAARLRAELGIPAGAPVVTYLGRLARDKGVRELAVAWQDLRQRYPALHLMLVGPEDTRDALDPDLVARLERDERAHLTGMREDVPVVLAASDLLVLPTYREGFGNVLLEASAMELPVVASDVGGCRDAVEDGETGVLVPPRDPAAIAAAVARYLDDPELRRRHGTAGRRRVLAQFRPEQLIDATLEVYDVLLRERGVARGLPPARPMPARATPTRE